MLVLDKRSVELEQAVDVLEHATTPQIPAPRSEGGTVLRDVVIVDLGRGDADRQPVDIEIVGGTIAGVTASAGEGEGGVVTPGLVDMHTHLPTDNPMRLAPLFGLLYLAHGVTTVRDTGDIDGTAVRAARHEFDRSGAGPRIVPAGPFIEGQGEHRWPNTRQLADPAQARDLVTDLAAEGSQLVKAYEHLTVPALRALAEAGEAVGLPVIGHVPHNLAYEDALLPEAQHFFGVAEPDDLTCSSVVCRGGDWAHVDERRLRDVLDVTVEHGLGNCPTLAQTDGLLRYRHPHRVAADPTVRLLPPCYARVVWHHERGLPVYRDLTPERLDGLEDALRKKQRLSRLLVEHGARIHLGTDVQQPFVIPGAALHREMELFHQAGIGAPTIWRLATLGAHDQLGTIHGGRIERGAPADLLVHRRDPTTAVEPRTTLVATMREGRLFAVDDLWAAITAYQEHHQRADIDAACTALAEFAVATMRFTG